MNRERAKELLPIIQAYAEGKKLQYKVVGDEDWHDVDDEDGINEGTRYEYRVNPEEETEITSIEELKKEHTSYRPFKSCNELVYYWEREKVGYSANPLQMIDIWVKHKADGRRRMIVGFGENFVEVGVKAKPVTLERLFEMYTFLDNEPCGVKEKYQNENK